MSGISLQRRHRLLTTLLLILFAMATLLPAAAQDEPNRPRLFITGVDSMNFPEVRVHFRLLGPNNQFVADVSQPDISLTENNDPVSLSNFNVINDGPVHTVFMLDLGYAATFALFGEDKIKDALRQFGEETYFHEGVDTVSIVYRANPNGGTGNDDTSVHLAPTSSREQFLQSVNNLNLRQPGEGNARYATYGLRAIERAITEMTGGTALGSAAMNVVYLGRMIELPVPSQAEEGSLALASEARSHLVRVYALHTDLNNARNTSIPLHTVTTGSGGQYLYLDQYDDNTVELARIYEDMTLPAQRTYYSATYRSTSSATTHQVMVSARGTSADSPVNYDIALEQPTLVINEPASGSVVTREAVRDEAATDYYFDVDSTPVTASIQWPNNQRFQLNYVELVVDDNNVVLSVNNPEGDVFNLTWTVAGIREDQSHALQVRAQDELGRIHSSTSVVVNVAVIIPEGVAEIEVIETTIVRTACEEDLASSACVIERVGQFGPWVIVALLGTVVFLQRRRFANAVVSAGRTFVQTQFVRQIRKTFLGHETAPQRPMAHLHVVDGAQDWVGRDILLTANITTLGRDPQQSDKQVRHPKEQSSVSGQHCTIKHKGRGEFVMIDDNSANGTLLNGNQLQSGVEYPLHNEDMIILGDMQLNGAQLIFRLVQDTIVGDDSYDQGFSETLLDHEYSAEADHVSGPSYRDSYTYADPAPPPPRPPAPRPESPHDGGRKLEMENDSWLDDLGG